MKIAVLSDIHGNYPALETVIDHIDRWNPNFVYVAGDIVNRGPCSYECMKVIEDQKLSSGWKVIRGNHEDYVISRSEPNQPTEGSLFELHQPTNFVYQQFNCDVSELVSLPEDFDFITQDYGEVRMRHASMRYNRDGIYPETPNYVIKKQISPLPNVFITGHTHRPFVRQLDKTLVVNAGSVGLPFDGDFRTGYAQISYFSNAWHGEIIRLGYDIEKAETDFGSSGFLEGGGPITSIVLLELRTASSQLYHWSECYSNKILDGTITVKKATEKYLENSRRKIYWWHNSYKTD